jgi:gluconolactonase
MRTSTQFDAIVPPGAYLELLGAGFANAEGPVWLPEEGALLFSDLGLDHELMTFRDDHHGRRMRWSPDGGIELVHEPTNRVNGMTRDLQGRIVMCETETRRVTRLEHDGNLTILANQYRGLRFTSPNDVVVKSDGSIYFTDSGGGMLPGADLDYSGVFRIAPDLSAVNLLARDFVLANGLAFSPDETVLYVNDSQGAFAHPDAFLSHGTIRAFDVRATGMLANGRLLCEMAEDSSGMPDGMKVDREGNVYCTGPGGIWVLDPSGRHLGTLDLDVQHNVTTPTNLAWGGDDLTTLFITTCSTLLRIELGIPGASPVSVPDV